MLNTVDFTTCIEELNIYKGKEKKKTLLYNEKRYLVKFPDPVIVKNKDISYINNAFSEYIGSNIFELTGFTAQNTILGNYNYNGNKKTVCACEDFTDNNHVLYEFENLALSANPDKKIETELADIINVIEEINNIDSKDIINKFWDMFIVDALIGNTDRHNGNWGFILNKQTNELTFSPIYDCGSCLNPILSEEEIATIDQSGIKNLAINVYSCFKDNGTKINYMTFINGFSNIDCNNALLRVFPKININDINKFIDEISCMSENRKLFYKNILAIRYDILRETYNKIYNA